MTSPKSRFGRLATRVGVLAVACATAVALLSSAGCLSGSHRGGDIRNIDWIVKSCTSAGKTLTAPAGLVSDAAFTTGAVSGTVVNAYGGPFVTKSDGAISMTGPFTSTKKAGPAEWMAFENAYLGALARAKSYFSDGKRLVLYDGQGSQITVFEKSTITLVGDWRVLSYNNGKQAVVSVIATSTVTATFDVNGAVSGNSGVNSYSGRYKTEGASGIAITQIGSTLIAGPEDLMAQESAYLKALESASTYSIEGQTLELRTADGALAVQMKLAP